MTKGKSLQATQDTLLDRHNVNHEVNQGFDRVDLQTGTINIEESQDIENLLSYYDEDIQTDNHWDVIDGQLKEFACPKLSKNTTKTDFKNDNKIVQFPENLDTIKCAYIKVLNSDKFKDKPFWWFHCNKERHIAKLIIEEQYTRLLLRKCINSGMLKNIDEVIYHGSESLILHANFNSPTKGLNHCAIKVFKTKLQDTISSEPYVKPDCKLEEIFVNKNTRQVVRKWAKTEYEMLVKMQEIGINAPSPICHKSHCVFMSFIGDEKRAPSLAELVVPTEKWQYIYSCVLEAIDKLYFEGDLVHGDLNENNILWWDNKCWLIDFSQALPKDHEMARYNLKRDRKRIAQFFRENLYTE